MHQKNKWDNQTILQVWSKAEVTNNNNPAIFRKDACDAWIKFQDHGNRNSQYGWEIDHIIPDSQNGSDELDNLQPLQWENNVKKGDSQVLKCAVRSNNNQNVNI